MPKRSPTCRCCCQWVITVTKCDGTPLDGFTVTISQDGVDIDTGVSSDGTDGLELGQVIFKPPAGSYVVTMTPPAGTPYVGSTQTLIYSC